MVISLFLWSITVIITRFLPPVKERLELWEAEPELTARERKQQTRVVLAFMLIGILPICFGWR